MTKQKLGPKPLVWPHPAVLVGADVDGQPNFTAVAWTGVTASNPASVSISLQPHRHSLKGIRRNHTFSINVPSTDQIAQVDYCGLVSGRETDKVKDCGFTVYYGETPHAPLIEQCPINLECEAKHFLNLGSHILVIGTVMETHVSQDCLTGDQPDLAKVKPFVFGPRKYYAVGELLADAYSVGKSVKGEA